MLKTKRAPKLDAKLEAFSFQLAAVRAIVDKPYAAVFHEQGLGKTKIAIDLLLEWLRMDVSDSAFIVTKRSLVTNWTDEIRNHTHLIPRVVTQDRHANFYAFNSPSRLYLTHYEVLESEETRLRLFLKTRRVAIFLDESQKIKNPEAALTQAVVRLSQQFVRRIILTGTPVANRPYDLWSQIFFLDAGKALGTDFAEFKRRLDLTNDMHGNLSRREQFERDLSTVFSRIADFSVRETKASAGISLPGKTIRNWSCELEARQSEIYSSYRDELKAVVMKRGVAILDSAEDILKRLLRLVQVAANPTMLDQAYRSEPGKLLRLKHLLYEITDRREKAIVWTSFVENSEWLARALSEFGCVVVNGSVGMAERDIRLKSFKDDEGTKILVATPGSAKEGLTLTVANHAIFFDRSFSLDDYLQAQDRIHRISQKRQCFIHNLIATDTVDEWVDMLIASKQTAAQLAQGDITIEQYHSTMSYDFGEAVRYVLGIEPLPEHKVSHGVRV